MTCPMCSLLAAASQFSVFIDQKMHLLAEIMLINMRNVKFVDTQTSIVSGPTVHSLYCAIVKLQTWKLNVHVPTVEKLFSVIGGVVNCDLSDTNMLFILIKMVKFRNNPYWLQPLSFSFWINVVKCWLRTWRSLMHSRSVSFNDMSLHRSIGWSMSGKRFLKFAKTSSCCGVHGRWLCTTSHLAFATWPSGVPLRASSHLIRFGKISNFPNTQPRG